MLRLGRSRLEVASRRVMMIDSLEMTAPDRARVVERCRACEESAIVVTHGTDTMVETAAALAERDRRARPIVLTGAMIPYAFGSSDGLFNLGQRAVVRAGAAARRVHRDERPLLRLDRVRKNRALGYFEKA